MNTRLEVISPMSGHYASYSHYRLHETVSNQTYFVIWFTLRKKRPKHCCQLKQKSIPCLSTIVNRDVLYFECSWLREMEKRKTEAVPLSATSQKLEKRVSTNDISTPSSGDSGSVASTIVNHDTTAAISKASFAEGVQDVKSAWLL